jgi:signal transduction histidine kinase/FixJ family two-component response regulator/HPt (histidine-containing phosphotransfer) domain-containing protein
MNIKKFGANLNNLAQILFVIFSFTIMVVVSYLFAANIVKKHMYNYAVEVLETAEEKIDALFKEAQISLLIASIYLKDGIEEGKTNEQLAAGLDKLTKELMEDSNAMMGFNGFLGFIRGEFISSVTGDLPDAYNPQERPWYAAAVRQNSGSVITNPYYDLHSKSTVISAAMTLRGQHEENYGVVSLNIGVDRIADYVKALEYTEGAYGILLDTTLTFVAHYDDSFIGKSMWDKETGKQYAATANELVKGGQAIVSMDYVNTKSVPVISYYRRMANEWVIGIATPKTSYYHDVYLMAVVLLILGIAMISVVCYILLSINKRKERSDKDNKAKTSFMARMSHEIRTPMNSIMGMCEILMRKNIPGDVYEYLSIIRQSGDTLLALINDVLDFSKIESGLLEIAERDYYLESLLNDVINVIRMKLADRPIDFFVLVDSKIPAKLVGDDMRLRQILINLLNNAAKYTREGHVTLDVSMEHSGHGKIKLQFMISDTGIGIKDEDKDRLFTEFTRLDLQQNQGVEGTGLGLIITKNLCRSMGGEITVTSEYGRGSIFTATIVQGMNDDALIASVKQRNHKRVLVFEDRPLYRTSLEQAFGGLKVETVFAQNIRDFCDKLLTCAFQFAFVSSLYAAECIAVWAKCAEPVQFIIMIELGDNTSYQNTGTIRLPAYSCTIANILNGKTTEGAHQSAASAIHFIAPTAKILIADDVATNLRVAAELMAPYNMKIDTCLSGYDAIEKAKKKRYDIIFMDHMMPGLDGLEATAAIRKLSEKDSAYKDLPIIMLTANALLEHQELFFQNGISDFLAKPIDTKKLNDVLEKWLPAKKRIRRHLLSRNDEKSEITLPSINDVDTLAGFFNTGGTLHAYENILEIFCQDALERIPLIRDAVETNNLKQYITITHALKSASRSIGAVEFSKFAALLEEAGELENHTLIIDTVEKFIGDLQTLVYNIKEAVKEFELHKAQNETKKTSDDVSTLRLEALKTALIDMDTDSVNAILIEYRAHPFDPETRQFISKIEQDILLFEYEKAVEKINTFGK